MPKIKHGFDGHSKREVHDLLDKFFLHLAANGICKETILLGGYYLSKKLATRTTVDIDLNTVSNSTWGKIKTLSEEFLPIVREAIPGSVLIIKEPKERANAKIAYTYEKSLIIGLDLEVYASDLDILTDSLNITTGGGTVVDVSITAHSIERILVDKLGAAFSKANVRRVKDFFDIYTLLTTCTLDFTLIMLAMRRTNFARVPDEFLANSPFEPERFAVLEAQWNSLPLRSPVSLGLIDKPEFSKVISILQTFLYQTSDCVELFKYKWNPSEGVWYRC